MIRELIQSVLQQEGVAWLQKMEHSTGRQTEIRDTVCDAIVEEMRDTLISGKSEEIEMALTDASTSHLVQRSIKRSSLNLLFNLGLSAGMSDTISSTLIPMVFTSIASDKSIRENAFTDIEKMMRDLNPERSEDQLGDMLGGMFGLR